MWKVSSEGNAVPIFVCQMLNVALTVGIMVSSLGKYKLFKYYNVTMTVVLHTRKEIVNFEYLVFLFY